MAGKLQNEDFKTEAELIGAGGAKSQLLNDTKLYVTANSINKTLDDAIIDGDFSGSAESVSTQAGDYIILDGDGFTTLLFNDTSSDRLCTLPGASANANRRLKIKNISTDKGKVTLDGQGAETIDGLTTIDLDFKNCFLEVQPDGTEWHIISENITSIRKSYIMTVTATNWTTTRAVGRPYRDIEGNWYLIVNVCGNLSVSSSTNDLSLTGVTWKNGPFQSGAVNAFGLNAGNAHFVSNSGVIQMVMNSNKASWSVSSDVELNIKPTFVE